MHNSLNVKIEILGFVLLTLIGLTAKCQEKKQNLLCNRATADKALQRVLPRSICIASNQQIDQVIASIDFDKDSQLDIILRHTEFPRKEKAKIYFSFYQRITDTTFLFVKSFDNILPPLLENIYKALSSKDSSIVKLANTYPYDTRIEFSSDTITLSHMIPQYYGKSYQFVFAPKQNNWLLKRTIYWIGELDAGDVDRMGLPQKLINRNTLEVIEAKESVSLGDFRLEKSRLSADNEESEYMSSSYSLFEWVQKND